LAALLKDKCGRDAEEAAELASNMFDHGFGPAVFTTTKDTWEFYLGQKDGGSIYAWIVALSREPGALPSNLTMLGSVERDFLPS
jgi:hypothetical protein